MDYERRESEGAGVGEDRDSGRNIPTLRRKISFSKFSVFDYVRSGKALAKVMEYAGEAIEELSVDERATMTNMVRNGGFTGI